MRQTQTFSLASICLIASLSTVLGQSPTPSPSPSASLTPFQKADANGDNKITKDEIPTYMTEYAFQQGDTNHDGKLSAAEAKAMSTPKTPNGPPVVEIDHAAADTDGDGQLDKQEFQKALDKQGNIDLIANTYDIDQDNALSDTELQSNPVNVGISFKF